MTYRTYAVISLIVGILGLLLGTAGPNLLLTLASLGLILMNIVRLRMMRPVVNRYHVRYVRIE